MKNALLFLTFTIVFIGNSQTLTTSNLPIVVITTPPGQNIVDDPRIVCHLGIIDNGSGNMNNITDPFNDYDGRIEIEVRGSTSQQYPKKGYGFETQDSLGIKYNYPVLGMGSENDWILYGPYPDKTLIRNVLTFDLARQMGHYAPATRYCELKINDEYRGIYILMERIKRDNDRVDIEDIHIPNTWDDTLTGGFIFKVDKLTGDVDYSWESNYNNEVVFQFHDPEFLELHPLQASYGENYINDFETTMNSSNFADPTTGYPSLIDRTSFQDFFILQELGRTVDGYRSSSFLHKDRDGFSWNAPLIAGPMWDFNLSYGNADYCGADLTTGWQYNFDDVCGNFSTSIPFWWERLLEDPAYANSLKCRWNELREGPLHTDSINAFIDSVAIHIEDARIRNFQKWPIIGVYVNWNGFVGQTYQEDLDYLKTYMEQRSIWIDNNLPGNCNLATPEIAFSPEFHKVWPNPTESNVNLGLTLFDYSKVEISILDNTGRIVKTENLGSHSPGTHAFTLNLDQLETGTYFYSIQLNETNAFSGKIIKH